MRNIVSTYVNKFLHERKERYRLLAVVAVLALLVAGGVFWRLHYTGVALTNEVNCGKEEHEHTEECYEEVLVCGFDDEEGHTHTDACYETQKTLICGQEEQEGHTHTDACYTVIPSELICGQEESAGHTHSESCYDGEGNLICVLEESAGHVHSSACYSPEERALTCGMEESAGHVHSEDCYQTERVLICDLEEGETAEHEHTEDCYEEQLVCELEEHKHTIDCMSDESADVETAADWEATLPKDLTGIWGDDVVAIAKSQIGYTESTRNFVLSDTVDPAADLSEVSDSSRKGYTRYGAWYGSPYADWCAMFASFCLHYAGVPENLMPEASGTYAWILELDSMGLYADVKSTGYTPVSGDLVFFDMKDGDSDPVDHVGIIESIDWGTSEDGDLVPATITTIEGNSGNMVRENVYSVSDSRIVGYGILPGQSGVDEETAEDWEETLPELSGSPAKDLVSIAESQLGYNESARNFYLTMENNTKIKKGYTRYGAWYGDPYGDWDAMFASFCLHYADSRAEMPAASTAAGLLDEMKEAELYKEAAESTPSAGDLAFFAGEDGEDESVAIITDADSETITVIKGDSSQTVRELTYSIYNENILGYGHLSDEETGTAGALTYAGEDYRITVSYEEKALIPSGTELQVSEYDEDSEAYQSCYQKAIQSVNVQPAEDMEEEEEETESDDSALNIAEEFHMFHIELVSEEEKIEPSSNVEVVVEYLNRENPAECQVFCFDGGTEEALLSAASYCEGTQVIGFDTAKLGDIGILSTVGEETGSKGTLTYEGEDYIITVTFDEDAKIPSDAELIASEYEKDSEIYQARYEEASEVNDWPEAVAGSIRLFNVGIYSNGEEVEPAAQVQVSITYLEPEKITPGEDEEERELSVTHFGEDTEVLEAESTLEEEGETIRFEVDGFSDIMVASVGEVKAEYGDDPDAIQRLAASGYFEYWSNYTGEESGIFLADQDDGVSTYAEHENDGQIDVEGGTTTSDDGVTVSKTIEGTDTENVFDITLTVETTTEVSTLYEEPDMAVVLVLDISNTMMTNTLSYTDADGTTSTITRYEAAMRSAENFLDEFADETNGISKVGFVAFNTDATKIFDLQSCSSKAEATTLKNTMRTGTGNIVNASGYSTSWSRFTDIEAGLKMAYDMLSTASNDNQFIVFISDGLPTTYIKSGYTGYEPYSTSGTKGADGVFCNMVTGEYCSGGTNYSDKGAIRARTQATTIKNKGISIFSIGVDVDNQYLSRYSTATLDITSTNYEIGTSADASAFKNWLTGSATAGIGSGYYYDCTDTNGLQKAFSDIFGEIKEIISERSQSVWVVTDPMPTLSDNSTVVDMDFVGFYSQDGALQVYPPTYSLTGESREGGENSVSYDSSSSTITWDLKNSGYTASTVTEGSTSTTTYTYTLTYRIREENELAEGEAETHYPTNGRTYLTYQTVTTVNGEITWGEEQIIDFVIPEVEEYYGTLSFIKTDQYGNLVAGVAFTLTHDTDLCQYCRGDGDDAVEVDPITATSNSEGKVEFTHIPSGHYYTLTETVPSGYLGDGKSYEVHVSYGVTEVTVTDENGTTTWDLDETNTIENEAIELYIYKYDSSGTDYSIPLEGAEFVLSNSDEKYAVVDSETGQVTWTENSSDATTLVSAENGFIHLYPIAAGTYTLTETKAPDGFNLLPQSLTITVNADGSTADAITVGNVSAYGVANSAGRELPNTGGPGTTFFILAGLLTMVGAACFLYKNKKREENTY